MSTPPTVVLPPGVEASTLATARGDFALLQTTTPASRGSLLLLPGWTGSKEDFIVLLPLLAERGWHAVSYDQRGQHETAGAADDDYSLEGLAADVHAVADALGLSTLHLLGHSLGGLVAQRAAVSGPERWRSLTLLCSGPGAFTVPAKVALLRSTVDALTTLPLDEVYAAKVRYDGDRRRPGGPPSAGIERFLRDRFVRNSAASLIALTGHLLDAPDRLDEVAALRLPVHVVHGADDDGWPISVQQQMARRLGVSAHAVADAAHSPNVENPTATARLLTTLLG